MSHGLSERSELSGPPGDLRCAHGVDLAGRYRVGTLVRTDGRCCTHEGHDVVLRRPVSVTLATPESGIPIPPTLPLPTGARYRHGPGLGEIYDGGDDHGTVYLVTQAPEGVSLADELRGRRLTPAEVRELGAGIARALLPAHRHGSAHGALEADTVGLGPDRVTVAGLGVGEWLSHWAQVDDRPHYPAPEQLADRTISPATDVFALGALLAEAAEPLPPEDPLTVLLRQMCADDPGERPTTEQVLVSLTAGGPTRAPHAPAEPLVEVGPRSPEPRRGADGRTAPAVTAIAGLVVAAALTLATVVVHTSDASTRAFVGGATVATDSAAPAVPGALQFLMPPMAREANADRASTDRASATVAATGTADAPAERHRATPSSRGTTTTAPDRADQQDQADRQDRSADEHRSSGDVTTSPAEPTAKTSPGTTSPQPTDSSKPSGSDKGRPSDPTRVPGRGGPAAGHASADSGHKPEAKDGTPSPKVVLTVPKVQITVTAAPGDSPSTATDAS